MPPKRRSTGRTSARSEPPPGPDPAGEGDAPTRRGRWSKAELDHLRRHYGLRPEEDLARELSRSLESVREAARRLFAERTRRGPWSDEEVERLKDCLGATPTDVIARVLGRSQAEVERQVERLGRVRRTGRWTNEEVQRLRRIYGRRTDEDLARIFGRSVESVRRQAARYALAKDKAFVRRLKGEAATRMPRWSEEELRLLAELYPAHPNLDIAKRLSRSVKSVVSKAHHLGLRKDEERLREMGRQNVRRRYARGS